MKFTCMFYYTNVVLGSIVVLFYLQKLVYKIYALFFRKRLNLL